MLNKTDKQIKLAVINNCILDFDKYPYDFWKAKIGDNPLIVTYVSELDFKSYDIEIETNLHNKKKQTIVVSFTIWGGLLKIFGTSCLVFLNHSNNLSYFED
jgi:hypothetical protein